MDLLALWSEREIYITGASDKQLHMMMLGRSTSGRLVPIPITRIGVCGRSHLLAPARCSSRAGRKELTREIDFLQGFSAQKLPVLHMRPGGRIESVHSRGSFLFQGAVRHRRTGNEVKLLALWSGREIYITGASGKQLQCDDAGAIGLRKTGAYTDNKNWRVRTITPAGAGEVVITSWKGKKLTQRATAASGCRQAAVMTSVGR